ncbi:FlgD immunoglobulin-like domain containing protein [Planctomycetota bacterium]
MLFRNKAQMLLIVTAVSLLLCIFPVSAFAVTSTWDGSESTVWEVEDNWSDGVPTSTDDAVIPAGCTFYPVVTVTDAECAGLTVEDEASLTVNAGGKLTVNADFTCDSGSDCTISQGSIKTLGNVQLNGTFDASTGTMVFSSSSTQTIGGSIAAAEFNYFTITKWNGTLNCNLSDVTAHSNFKLTSGTLNAGSGTYHIKQDIQLYTVLGNVIFNADTSTFRYEQDQYASFPVATFYNLDVELADADHEVWVHGFGGEGFQRLGGPTKINNHFDIISGVVRLLDDSEVHVKGANADVRADGQLIVEGGGTLKLGSNSTDTALSVESGGALRLLGVFDNTATITSTDGLGRHSATINGIWEARNFLYEYTGAAGIIFTNAQSIENLTSGTFDYPPEDGTILNMSGVAEGQFSAFLHGPGNEIYLDNITFDNSEPIEDATNVLADATTTTINFREWSGDLGGETYETDPGNTHINWLTADDCTVTWDGSESMLWNVADNWTPARVPGSGDKAVIPDVTTQPVILEAHSLRSIEIQDGATVTVAVYSSTVITLSKDLIIDSGGTFTINDGVLEIGNEFNCNGSFNWGISTVRYNGEINQNIEDSVDYYHLDIDNGTNIAYMTGVTLVRGNLSISSGTFHTNVASYTLTVNGDLSIAAGGTLVAGHGIIWVYGDWSDTGTFDPGNGSIILKGFADSTVGAETFYNLTLAKYNSSGPYYTVTATGDITVQGKLIVGSDSRFVNDYDLTLEGEIEISNEMELTGGNTDFQGEVTIKSDGNLIAAGGTNTFQEVVSVESIGTLTTSGGANTFEEDITVQSNGAMAVTGGNIEIKKKLLAKVAATIDIDVDVSVIIYIRDTLHIELGALFRLTRGILRMGTQTSGGTILIEGQMDLLGADEANRVTVVAANLAFPMTFTAPGTINFNYFKIDGFGTPGIACSATTTVTNFQNGILDHPAASGVLVDFSSVTQFDPALIQDGDVILENMIFDNSGVASNPCNVRADAATAKIIFSAYGGSIGGEDHDDDEYYRIHWTPLAPNPPQNLTGIPGNTVVHLYWTPNKEPYLGGYNLYRGTASGVYDPTPVNGATPISATETYFLDDNDGAGLSNGTPYYYVLTAVNSADHSLESSYSNEVEATPFVTLGPTNISGIFYTNQHWTKEYSPYVIDGLTYFRNNATLTIDPGVEVEFNVSRTIYFDDQSNLYAVGTSSDHITFAQQAGSGSCFLSFTDAENTVGHEATIKYTDFDYCRIRNQDDHSTYTFDQVTMDHAQGDAFWDSSVFSIGNTTTISITNTTISNSTDYALDIAKNAIIQDCTFTDNTTGIRINANTLADLSNISITGTGNKIYIDPVTASTTGMNRGNVSKDTTIQDYGVPYVVTGTSLVFFGTDSNYLDITIEAGVEMQFSSLSYDLYFRKCNVDIIGTTGNRILFTSDNVSPSAGDWNKIDFQDCNQVDIQYADVKYGQFPLYITDTDSVSIDNCLIDNSTNICNFDDTTSISIENTTFSNFSNTAIDTDSCGLTFDYCTFDTIGRYAIIAREVFNTSPPLIVPTITQITNCDFDDVGYETGGDCIIARLPIQCFNNFSNNTFQNLNTGNPYVEISGRCWDDVTVDKLMTSDGTPEIIKYYATTSLSSSTIEAIILDDRLKPITVEFKAGVFIETNESEYLILTGTSSTVEGYSNNLNIKFSGTSGDHITLGVKGSPIWNGFFLRHGKLDMDYVDLTECRNIALEYSFGQVTIDNCTIDGNSLGSSFGVKIANIADRKIPVDVTISNTEISNMGSDGIRAPDLTSGFVIDGCSIHDCMSGIDGDNLTILNSEIYSNSERGIEGASLIIRDCDIYSNTKEGLYLEGTCEVSHCDIRLNDTTNDYGLYTYAAADVNAFCNYWGDASGPGGIGPGSGQDIGRSNPSHVINFNAWLDAASFSDTSYFTEGTFTPLTFNNDGGESIGKFHAKLTASASWQIDIYEKDTSTLRKRLTGTGSEINQEWDGTGTASGVTWDGIETDTYELEEDTYSYTFSASGYTDADGEIVIDQDGMRGEISNIDDYDQFYAPDIDIVGTALGIGPSSDQFEEYYLYYGEGIQPLSWMPIEWGTGDRSTWTPNPTTIKNNADLGTWDISSLLSGYYTIKLEVLSTNSSTYPDHISTVIVEILNMDITNISAYKTGGSDPMFDPNITSETLTIAYTLSEAALVTIKIYDVDGTTLKDTPVDGASRSSGANTDTWDGEDSGDEIVSDGVYSFVIEAVSTTPPSGRYGKYNPEYILSDITVEWKQFDRNFAFEQRPFMAPLLDISKSSMLTLTQGESVNIFDDKPFLDGESTIRLNGRDDSDLLLSTYYYRITGIATVPDNYIVVGSANTCVSNAYAHPFGIRPYLGQVTTIYYELDEQANVEVKIYDTAGTLFHSLQSPPISKSSGVHSLEWDGQDSNGRMPAPGNCTYKITAVSDNDGRTEVIQGNISIVK